MDTSLVGEGGESGNVVVKGNVDLDAVGDKVLDSLELVEVVLVLDVIAVGDDHSGHQATEGSDTVPLTDTDDRGVNVRGTSLESAVGVGDGASRIVVEMALDVATDDTTKSPDEVVDLSRRSTALSLVSLPFSLSSKPLVPLRTTVSAIPTRLTPTLSTAAYKLRRSTRSDLKESSDENRISRPLDLTN